jgi:hypothetical protein
VMRLPESNLLNTEILAQCFNSTSATYKYYWFLAIIEEIEMNTTTISKHRLFTKMVTNAWYTVNYFKLSFGKQDLIHEAVENIRLIEGFTIDEKKSVLINRIEKSKNIKTISQLNHFNNNVPHWFLSPWFPKLNGETDAVRRSRIYNDSNISDNNSLYALHEDYIIVNPIWLNYLKTNAKVIKDFIYWNLTLFLQTRNPNITDIAGKIIKPATRNSLTNQRKNYWKNVFEDKGFVQCIFTNTKLKYEENNFAIDHFIPHAFISHDLIWNLIPIDSNYNSFKSDKLPILKIHFDEFYKLQKCAFDINKNLNPKSKYMEEYLTIFHSTDFTKENFQKVIEPLITIAHNNGFTYLDETHK